MRSIRTLTACALALTTFASLGVPARAEHPTTLHSRVIVSSTLNSTLHFFDAYDLVETQPPLISRGLAPVRLDVFDEMATPVLLAANHGIQGSIGMFDLSGDIVLEMPASPIPARPGSVGIDAAVMHLPGGDVPMAFVTNTWQALGGCSLPKGSLTAYQIIGVDGAPTTMVEAGTVELNGAIPYAVAADPAGRAYASTNCGNSLDTVSITPGALTPTIQRTDSRGTDPGPDGVVFDATRGRAYVVNIAGSSLGVYDASTDEALATVPVIDASGKLGKPIDLTLADSPNGHHWVITANGGNDTVSIIDRDILDTCVGSCPQAVVATIGTGVAGGAPEGVAYDPVTNRIFVVNKPIPSPSLTVIQLDDSGEGVSGAPKETIPLSMLGSASEQPPDLISFDVVVQTR